MAIVERAAVGSRTAMRALGAHTGSVAGVAGKQADSEVEEAEQSARSTAALQYFPAEVERCFARTTALFQYFQEAAGIEADCRHMRNWVVTWMFQSKKDSRAVAGGCCIEAVIEIAADVD
jgi:hypothetical protein